MAMSGLNAQSDGMTPLKSSSLDAVSTLKNSQAEESIAEPELLALIIELRLNTGGDVRKEKEKGSTVGSNKSTSTSTSAAVDTLDLCHRKIEKLPNEMVDIIRDDVVRLALGYNLINSLPSNFSELFKLRYLNIRANLITSFPTVLCTLPSLEILDISRNKIRKLPSEPGRLSELRVLSISNNKLRKLPSWLQRARHLRILKIDGNPITWPPPHISVMPPFDKASTITFDGSSQNITSSGDGDKETQQANKKRAEDRHMALWIQKVRQWMAEDEEVNSRFEEKELAPALLDPLESTIADGKAISSTEPLRIQKKPNAGMEDGTVADESKPLSDEFAKKDDSALLAPGEGAASDEERDKDQDILALPIKAPVEGKDPVAMTDLSDTMATSAHRPVAENSQIQNSVLSPVMPLVTSPEQVRKPGEANLTLEAMTGPALQKVTQVSNGGLPTEAERTAGGVHSHNHSVSNVQPVSSVVSNMATTLRRGLMRNKKSLPDLRQTTGGALLDKKELTSPIDDGFSSGQRPRRPSANSNRHPPLPQATSESLLHQMTQEESNGTGADQEEIRLREKEAEGSTNMDNRVVTPTRAANGKQDIDTPIEPLEGERNRYFRRFSTLPSSTVSKSIPIPVLECVDATRGILYALSQLHSALKQYITFASDERMTSQLSRALDIASTFMATLIQSLDRFDSLSRINGDSLNTTIIQSVITACSDSVVTFRKIISLLHLQLKTLHKSADIRYTRTLLLLLYGSLGEISHSWTIMEPLFTQVIPYLNGQDAPSATSALPHVSNQTYTLPSIAEASSPILANSDRSAASYAANHLKPHRRRHAGSFSAQDVAQGAYMIPSAPLPINGHEDIRRGQRPSALGPFAKQQGQSTYQVQQGDLDGTELIHTGRFIPNESERTSPQNRRERLRRNEDTSQATVSSKRSVSNTSVHKHGVLNRLQGGGSNSSSNDIGSTTQALPSALFTGTVSKVLIDDHLVLLLVKVTSVAYSVWASIMDHLGTVDSSSFALATSTNDGNVDSANELPQQKKTPETSPHIDEGSFSALSPQTPLQSGPLLQREGITNKEPSSSLLSPSSDVDRITNGLVPTVSTLSKIERLREMTLSLIDQTNALQACCDKVQERSGIASASSSSSNGKASQQQQQSRKLDSPASSSDDIFQEVYIQSSTFIKSILQVSHFIKSLSLEHTFPKSIKFNLAQLTICARDLTLHLHFLGGPPSSQSISTIVSPAQHRGDDSIPSQSQS